MVIKTHRSDVDRGERGQSPLAQYEDAQRLAIFLQGLWNKIRGIVAGRAQHTAWFDKAGQLVKFTLGLRSQRNLSHAAVEFLRSAIIRFQIVPRVSQAVSPCRIGHPSGGIAALLSFGS